MNCIEETWQKFHAMALPNIKVGTVQYKEMRKAFICGFYEAFHGVVEISRQDEDKACAQMSLIANDLNLIKHSLTQKQKEN